MSLLSTAEAADRLGIHPTRVQVLIREGRLPAQKVGRAYVIEEADLRHVEDRQPGRPPKSPAGTTATLNRAFRKSAEAANGAGTKPAKKSAKKKGGKK